MWGRVSEGVEPPSFFGLAGGAWLALEVDGHFGAGLGFYSVEVFAEVFFAGSMAAGAGFFPGLEDLDDGVGAVAPGEAGGQAGFAFDHADGV